MKASGKTVVNEPWKLNGKVKANAQSALLEQIEFQYGPEQRAAKLDGAAEIKFGERPRMQGALSARQIDLDRLIATADAPRRLPARGDTGVRRIVQRHDAAVYSGEPNGQHRCGDDRWRGAAGFRQRSAVRRLGVAA